MIFHIRLYKMKMTTFEYIKFKENKTTASKIVKRVQKATIESSEYYGVSSRSEV